MGGACGLAISGAVLQATLRSHLPAGYGHLSDSTYSLPSQSSIPVDVWDKILEAYTQASKAVFILQVPLIGVCFLACLLIRDRGLERPKDAAEQEEERREKRKENGNPEPDQTLTPARSTERDDGGESEKRKEDA